MKASPRSREDHPHKGWVAVELTQEGDLRASDGSLERMLRRDLGVSASFPVFIPIRRSALAEKSVIVSAMDGYVFVGAGLPSSRYLALEKRSYAEQVLCRPVGSGRVPHIVPDKELNPLRGQINRVERLPAVRRGTQVEVSSGMLAALRGTVLDLDRDQAVVQFTTKTLVRILSLPVSMLRVAEEDPPAAPSPAPDEPQAGAAAASSQPTQRSQPMQFSQTSLFPSRRRRRDKKRARSHPRPKVRRSPCPPAQKVARTVQLGFKW